MLSVVIPQPCVYAVLIEVNGSPPAIAVGDSANGNPQHDTVPLVATPHCISRMASERNAWLPAIGTGA